MQIIKFNGGIGNQLFQYAFYKYCQINGIKASADISVYKKEDVHGGVLITRDGPKEHNH